MITVKSWVSGTHRMGACGSKRHARLRPHTSGWKNRIGFISAAPPSWQTRQFQSSSQRRTAPTVGLDHRIDDMDGRFPGLRVNTRRSAFPDRRSIPVAVYRAPAHRLQLRGQLWLWPCVFTRTAPHSLFRKCGTVNEEANAMRIAMSNCCRQ